MDSELISVIVPAYNAEKYLDECLTGILGQSYSNIEVIVVNDGSTDCTPDIMESFMDSDPRIRIFTQENKGVSSARNLGIQNAKGRWICFVDADDTLWGDALKTLHQTALEDDSDVVLGDFCILDKSHSSVQFFEYEEHRVFSDTEKKKLYGACIDSHAYGNVGNIVNVGVPWGRIYRKSIIDNGGISFDIRLSNLEDMIFNLRFFAAADKISYVPVSLYNYRISDRSLVSRYDPDYMKTADTAVSELRRFIDVYGLEDELRKVFEYKRFSLFYECIQKGPANINCVESFSAKCNAVKQIAKDEELDGKYRKGISDYMTFPLKICGILTGMRLYPVLLLAIIFVLRLRNKNGRVR